MRLGRRSFLRFLGAAPAVAQTVSAEALTSLAGAHAPPLADGNTIAGSVGGSPLSDSIEEQRRIYTSMSDYIRVWGGLPAHVERDVRERSRYVGHLDPDIAALRSFSLNVKIAWQRERNFEKELERYRHAGWYEQAQSTFAKLTGFRWQW